MDYPASMELHTVAGRIRKRWVLPPKEYSAFFLHRGESVRFVDVAGKQVVDILCFNALDHADGMSMANSQVLNGRLELRKDDVICSARCEPMMTITDYSNESCFTYGSMCSEELNRIRYFEANTRNCRDNFERALGRWGMRREQLPNAFAVFMRVDVDDQGSLVIREPTSVAGDFYDLRAEMDLLVAASNCPQELNACNGYQCTPMGVIVYDD